MRNISDKNVVDRIKTHILCSIIVFRKWCRVRYNVQKHCRIRHATDANILRCIWFACCI